MKKILDQAAFKQAQKESQILLRQIEDVAEAMKKLGKEITAKNVYKYCEDSFADRTEGLENIRHSYIGLPKELYENACRNFIETFSESRFYDLDEAVRKIPLPLPFEEKDFIIEVVEYQRDTQRLISGMRLRLYRKNHTPEPTEKNPFPRLDIQMGATYVTDTVTDNCIEARWTEEYLAMLKESCMRGITTEEQREIQRLEAFLAELRYFRFGRCWSEYLWSVLRQSAEIDLIRHKKEAEQLYFLYGKKEIFRAK